MEELNLSYNHNGDVLRPNADIAFHTSDLPTKEEREEMIAAETLKKAPEKILPTKYEQVQGFTILSVRQRLSEAELLNAPFID